MASNYSIKDASNATLVFSSLEESLIQVPIHYARQMGTWVVALSSTGALGLTPYKYISAASTNATSLKAGAGTIGYITAMNNHATNIAYLKIYNKASGPVFASDVPVQVFMLPPGGGVAFEVATGISFTNGIAFGIVAGAADTDATAVAANQVVVSLGYK